MQGFWNKGVISGGKTPFTRGQSWKLGGIAPASLYDKKGPEVLNIPIYSTPPPSPQENNREIMVNVPIANGQHNGKQTWNTPLFNILWNHF